MKEQAMATKKMPKSKARTAYGLLSAIAALALAEPKRIRMSMFLNTNARKMLGANSHDVPACNTVGCICGWAVALKGTDAQVRDQAGPFVGFSEYGDMPGALVLGLNSEQAHRLFEPDSGITSKPGTAGHARQVVRRIRKFQKANRAQLLAKKV